MFKVAWLDFIGSVPPKFDHYLQPQLNKKKMKICYALCAADIIIVIATKWSHYLIRLELYIIFVNDDIVNARTWLVSALKNPMEPP